MRRILIVLALLCLPACAGSKPAAVDWPALIQDAAPTFEAGKCGPQIVWLKEVAVYDSAVIEGKLTVRRKCAESPK